jgi:DNA ligase (NAD+)
MYEDEPMFVWDGELLQDILVERFVWITDNQIIQCHMLKSTYYIIIIILLLHNMNTLSFLYKRNLVITSRYFTSMKRVRNVIKLDNIDINSLNEDIAKKTLIKLNKEIEKHDKLYYSLSTPKISDMEYDKLVEYAEKIIEKYPIIKHIFTKTSRVGYLPENIQSSKLCAHISPMLSLESTTSLEGVEKFITSINNTLSNHNPESSTQLSFVMEPKIDGCSLAVTYSNCAMVRATTRGDGAVGTDVTEAAKVISDIPHVLNLDNTSSSMLIGDLEVRGEVYISTDDFLAINAENGQNDALLDNNNKTHKQFATARNLASGALRNQPLLARQRRLKFYAYGITIKDDTVGDSTNDGNPTNPNPLTMLNISSQSDILDRLSQWGFKIAAPCHRDILGVEDIMRKFREVEANRNSLGFDADGVVIKVNSLNTQVHILYVVAVCVMGII